MRRKALVLLVFILSFVAAGVVLAYFSATTSQPLAYFSTATVGVAVVSEPVTHDGVIPGEEKHFLFTIKNVGNTPIQVRGTFLPKWAVENLDIQVIHGLKLEADFGLGMQEIVRGPFNLTAPFYVSSSGLEADLVMLSPNQEVPLRLTLLLDTGADTEYMNTEFTVGVALAAKQVTAGSQWPEFEVTD